MRIAETVLNIIRDSRNRLLASRDETETLTSGSEGGRWKSACKGNSLAAYPTVTSSFVVAAGWATALPTITSPTPLRGLVSARNWLCNVLRVEVHFGKVAARLTRRAMGGRFASLRYACRRPSARRLSPHDGRTRAERCGSPSCGSSRRFFRITKGVTREKSRLNRRAVSPLVDVVQ
jgi:hypothetical protein